MIVAELAAGRALDALIAEQVMGWERFRAEPELYNGQWQTALWRRHTATGWEFADALPCYSTNLADAWRVVEEITKIQRTARLENTRFAYWWDRAHLWAYSAEEAAFEICQAALAAVGAG